MRSPLRVLLRWVRNARWERDLAEELDFHREMKRRELADSAPAQAADFDSAVRREMGNVTYMEESRSVWIAPAFRGLAQDLRIEASQLRNSWGFALITVAILAIGIGLNAAIFTLLNGIVIRALPLPHPDRLVILLETEPGGCCSPPSWLDQRDFREQNHVFESLSAFSYDAGILFRSGNESRRVLGGYVTPDYFRTLEVKPILGRVFDASEGQPGRDNVVLLREDFWRTQLGGDPGVLQREVMVNGRKCSVIGILPSSFRFPWDGSEIWAPLVPSKVQATERGWHGFPLIGRLKPGISREAAAAELDSIMKRMARQFPDDDAGRGATLFPLQSWTIANTKTRLLVLQGAALAVFLMTCANVASMMLSRYASRRREYAVRSALGASRFRQVRQHLTESLVLASAGCIAGIAVGIGGVRLLLWIYRDNLPHAFFLTLDWRLVLFTVAVTLCGALVFGLTTAFHENASELEQFLRENNRSGMGRRGMRLRQSLVVAQIACAVALLGGAGALIRSFRNLTSIDVGIDTSHLLTMRIELPISVYTAPERIASFYEEAVRRVRSLPGVQAAAAINELPVQNYGFNSDVEVEGLPPHSPSFFAENRWITGDYFAAMRIPIVRGRAFLPEEMAGRNHAVIINQTMARQLWKDRNPIGYRVRYSSKDWFTVVGVMRDVRQSGLEQPARAEVIAPLSTFGEPLTKQSLVIRSSLPEADIVSRVRRELAAVDPEAALDLIKPMGEVIRDSIANHRITAALLTTFAAVALLLAAFGIYGVVSYAVAERRREFAVRMALGARPALLVRLIFRQSIAVVGLGLGLGVAGVYWVGRMLESLLYGASGLDPVIVATILPTLAAVAALAILVPAIRVVRGDPMTPLRES